MNIGGLPGSSRRVHDHLYDLVVTITGIEHLVIRSMNLPQDMRESLLRAITEVRIALDHLQWISEDRTGLYNSKLKHWEESLERALLRVRGRSGIGEPSAKRLIESLNTIKEEAGELLDSQ